MITSSQTTPSAALAPYVQSYIYRQFDTKGFDLVKPRHAVHEVAIHFFFEAVPVKLADPVTGAILKTGKRSGVTGMSSQYTGEMTFNGFYSFFEIIFMPHGFQSLFGIPPSELLNKIAWSEELFDSSIDDLYEQLCYCTHVRQMGALADVYLLKLLQRQRYLKDNRISYIIQSINKRQGIVNIDALAVDTNMSVRNFERLFTEQIGVPAKLYCCIARFNHALNLKLHQPKLHWTGIAHQTGYYDQMHLIKDFKRFSGDTPYALFKETPLLVETYME